MSTRLYNGYDFESDIKDGLTAGAILSKYNLSPQPWNNDILTASAVVKAEQDEAQAKLAAQKQTELSQKDNSSELTNSINKANTSSVLPVALFIGGLLIVLGIRSKK